MNTTTIPERGEWADDMGEISGFGNGYEQACRDMLKAGLRWLDEHPDANPIFRGFKGVFGVCIDDNEDAKTLSKAMIAACDGATGAMHQAVVQHLMFIRNHSWAEYVQELRKSESEEVPE